MKALITVLAASSQLPEEEKAEAASAPSRSVYPIALLTGFFVVSFHLIHIVTERRLAGWDTTSHFLLYTQMLEHLKAGELSWYELLWNNGYPAFSLYAPIPYIVFGAPHLLSLGLISPLLSFNLSLFLLALLLLWSFGFVGGIAFGERVRPWSIFLGVIALCHVSPGYDIGQNISNFIFVGLLPALVGTVLLMLSFGAYLRLSREFTYFNAFFAFLFGWLLSFGHILSAFFFFVLYLPLFILFSKKNRIGIIAVALLSLSAGSFWWTEMISHLWIATGHPIFSPGKIQDPLSVFFPNVNSQYFEYLGILLGTWEVPADLMNFARVKSLKLSHLLPACLFIMGGVIGIYELWKRREFQILVPFFLLIAFLPRTWLIQTFNISLHQYRLMLPLFHWWIVIGGFGFYCAYHHLEKSNFRLVRAFRYPFICIVLIAGAQSSLVDYKVGVSSYYHDERLSFLDDAPLARPGRQAINKIARLKPSGVIAAEVDLQYHYKLGSPHYFSSEIPLRQQLPVTPGLLAESSLSFVFSQAPLRVLSDSLQWSRPTLQQSGFFSGQSTQSFLKRLRMFRTEYFVGTSKYLRNRMEKAKGVREVYYKRPIGIYHLGEPKAELERSTTKPLLYIPRYGERFIHFAEWLYANHNFEEFPVLYSKDDYLEILKEDGEKFSGIILGFPAGAELEDSEREFWRNFPIAKIYLNINEFDSDDHQEYFRPRDYSVRSLKQFHETLLQVSGMPVFEGVKGVVAEDQITFSTTGGVRVNYSYAPRWHAHNGKRVYLAFPCFMWVFADGDTELRYKKTTLDFSLAGNLMDSYRDIIP